MLSFWVKSFVLLKKIAFLNIKFSLVTFRNTVFKKYKNMYQQLDKIVKSPTSVRLGVVACSCNLATWRSGSGTV